MAASAARRPIIYAAFGDKKLVASFAYIYDQLKAYEVKVADLFNLLCEYNDQHKRRSVFKYLLDRMKPIEIESSQL